MSQPRPGPVNAKMNLLEGGEVRGERKRAGRDKLRRMMNNPKEHRYYTQKMKRGEMMGGGERRGVWPGCGWLSLTDSGCQRSKVLFIYCWAA